MSDQSKTCPYCGNWLEDNGQCGYCVSDDPEEQKRIEKGEYRFERDRGEP